LITRYRQEHQKNKKIKKHLRVHQKKRKMERLTALASPKWRFPPKSICPVVMYFLVSYKCTKTKVDYLPGYQFPYF
jgi:hypothetical protein